MTLIDKTVSRILLPFMLLYSIYIIIHGHLTPGGGFQGGVLLAFLIILEFFLRERLLPSEAPFQVWSGGEILFLNITGGLIVMTAFIIIFHSMVKE